MRNNKIEELQTICSENYNSGYFKVDKKRQMFSDLQTIIKLLEKIK